MLREAYRSPDKRALTVALNRLAARAKWPRAVITGEAHRIGITHRNARTRKQRPRRLEAKASLLAGDGYTSSDLAEVMGVTRSKAEGWMRRGLMGRIRQVDGHRIPEKVVVTFLKRYTSEYDLKRVNQLWFTKVVFSGLNEKEGDDDDNGILQ